VLPYVTLERAYMFSCTSICTLVPLSILCLLSGCGGGGEHFDVAPVSGRVTVEGEPVSGGMIQITPQGAGEGTNPGKTGIAEIGSDGTFSVTTYTPGDGAVVGTATITAGATDPDSPWKKELKSPATVEIGPGQNQLTVDIKSDGTASVENAIVE